MRIIYEDGNYREEREKSANAQKSDDFVDVSSVSDEYKKNIAEENNAAKPYRPAASLRPAPTQAKEEAPTEIPAAQPIPAQPQYAPVQYPQGYPVQYVQYPQGYPVYPQGAYPQGYPIQYQPMQYPMPGQYPAQVQYQQPVSPKPQTASTQPDSGTRVIYQSPDFDRAEPSAQRPDVQHYVPQPRRSSLTQEDVVFSSPASARAAGYAPTADKKFDVDDMEMSVFELNSMAHKYHAKAKAFNPYSEESSLEVEEYEEVTEIPEDEEQDFSDEKKPKKKKSKKAKKRREAIRKTVLAVSLIAIVVSCFYLYNEYRLSEKNEEDTDKAQNLIIDDPVIQDVPEDSSGENPTPNSGNENNGESSGNSEVDRQQAIVDAWAEVREEFPNVEFPSDIQLKYAKLYGTNRDFVGYLNADGIDMNLPVVQGDDDEEYLTKSFFGKKTKYGCPFVTHLNNIPSDKDGLDMNTVIFGHHMKDGSVFGILDKYKSIEGFKAAPVISFNTLYHDYDWKIIGAFITNAYEKDDNGYEFIYYFTNLTSEERFSAYLNAVSERSIYYTGVDVLPTDKILTLSTCSYEFPDARFVVVARLVRNGESTDVDVSKATENDNPRYPQAYYDKKKIDNPYKDAYRWEVG